MLNDAPVKAPNQRPRKRKAKGKIGRKTIVKVKGKFGRKSKGKKNKTMQVVTPAAGSAPVVAASAASTDPVEDFVVAASAASANTVEDQRAMRKEVAKYRYFEARRKKSVS